MRFGKIFILGGAALAGTFVYNLQQSFTGSNRGSSSGPGFYSSVTGPGSLASTIRTSSNAREMPQQNYQQEPYRQQIGGGTNTFSPGTIGASPRNDKGTAILGGGKGDAKVIPDDAELIQAAAKGDKGWVERRLSYRVKVDSRDALRRTPLMYASWSGYDDICNRLIAAGANPQFKDREGNNAFDFAASRGLTNTLHFLLQRTHSEDDGSYMEYAQIIQATTAGDPAKLPKGNGSLPSINRISPEGQAPLHVAAGNGSVALMDALIKRGARVNISNGNKQTPLHWAAWNNQSDAARLLIEKGADVTATDLAGNTPLILAAQNGSTDTAKLLISRGVDRYASNKEGKTAALVAEDAGFMPLANILK